MTDPTDKNEDNSEEGFFMAGFSGSTGVPLKQMQDAIAQSTAFEATTVSGTTTADGLLKLNMTTWQHLIVELYSRSHICLLYPDDYGQFWAKVLDYNMAKVASTSVDVGVRYKTIM